ncbi:polysaccharide deacetylase family protein [Natrinema salaciae]|uniref:Peptidoglycan/xylan/chitin deacetylase, PgdA/CDA1 family n=1 Tax=Natrinema salaciae TaxID=1186196 RepID=A0A1H9GY21_9EURY|nr:hypothetical protein [Natrinema salaciae]SEQ55022.1 Peptidoglycan/xylan/chitin deacetylase, PgdA/CDA1 family [Natrinema salaciae]
MTNRNRRSFVTTVAAAGTLGLSGCLSQFREWRGGDTTSTEPTPNGDANSSETDDLPELSGESVEDFENLDDWTAMIDAGELEAEPNDPYAGSQSARLTASAGTDSAAIYRAIPDGLDLSGKALSLAVNFTGRDQLHLTLELFAPNSRNVHAMQRTLTGPSDRWVRVDFGTGRIDTQPDLTNVREIRLTARRRGDSSGSIDCRIDDLRAIDRPTTGKVLFLFDGTLESHYTRAFERMEPYGFPGVEAVMPEALGQDGRLTLDKLDELDDAGWDMAARPRTGASFLHEYTPEKQKGMIERTKVFLENRGFEDGARHFVTPRNILSPTARDLVEEYHEQAFRFGGAPNALPLTDPYNVGFFAGNAGDEARTYIDYAAEYGQLAVLQFDYIGDDGISERAFEGILEYVDAQSVEVVSASDLLGPSY